MTTTTNTRVNEIVTTLKTGVHTVVFTKANGETRTLSGTLDPVITETETTENVVTGEDLVHVFDTNVKEWRSFHVANVISVDGITVQ